MSGAEEHARRLIPRFYDVTAAHHDRRRDIRDLTLASLRAHIAVVTSSLPLQRHHP